MSILRQRKCLGKLKDIATRCLFFFETRRCVRMRLRPRALPRTQRSALHSLDPIAGFGEENREGAQKGLGRRGDERKRKRRKKGRGNGNYRWREFSLLALGRYEWRPYHEMHSKCTADALFSRRNWAPCSFLCSFFCSRATDMYRTHKQTYSVLTGQFVTQHSLGRTT